MNHYLLILLVALNMIASQSDDHYHTVLWTHYVQGHHDHSQTAQCYTALFKSNFSIHLYPAFIEHLFDTNHFQGITQLIPCVEHHITLNNQQELMIIESYLKVGNNKEAIKRLMVLSAKSYNDPEMALKIAHLYIALKDYDHALAHLTMFLEHSSNHSHHSLMYFSKAHIYFQLHAYNDAKQNAIKSLELNPSLQQAWLLLAFIYSKENNALQAQRCYNNYNSLVANGC